VDRSTVLREALEERRPVADRAVEHGRGGDAVLRELDVDPSPSRQVLEPGAPERPRVPEHGIEVER
jgi:hypothetical protein